MIREVNDMNFSNEVLNNDGLVVVDFWASWCGPCKMLTPVLEELSQELGADVQFTKVNVDENPELSQKFRIASIPTVMMFKEGKPVDTMVGFRPKQAIKEVITKHV